MSMAAFVVGEWFVDPKFCSITVRGVTMEYHIYASGWLTFDPRVPIYVQDVIIERMNK